MPTGVYISVPFCRSKCSFCNFASGVFAASKMQAYADRVCADIAGAQSLADNLGTQFDPHVDSIYLGGGTPSTLEPGMLEQLFAGMHSRFEVAEGAEITVECAPGTLSESKIATLAAVGVNRVSLGVQSFVDQEAQAVGRLHTRDITLKDIKKLRAAGIEDINVDLISGLPHQTEETWRESLEHAIATEVPHVSVYMLEVDEDSRLGRELIAGGTRYHAHHVPDEELTAEMYLVAVERLNTTGISQYEISNFARKGHESRHNLKYWKRQPYLGFGVDAHSMFRSHFITPDATRVSTAEELENYLANGAQHQVTCVDRRGALEEEFFLGLRLNEGVDTQEITERFSAAEVAPFVAQITQSMEDGLIEAVGERHRLTSRGRLLSNEVFARFLDAESSSPLVA